MLEHELITSVLEVCQVLSCGLNAVETANRLGAVLANAYGRVKFSRAGWTDCEVICEPEGDGVNDVVLRPLEKLSLMLLQDRFGKYEECAPISPFQPPRVAFKVDAPQWTVRTRMLASLSLDSERKPDGYVTKLMLIPHKKPDPARGL